MAMPLRTRRYLAARISQLGLILRQLERALLPAQPTLVRRRSRTGTRIQPGVNTFYTGPR